MDIESLLQNPALRTREFPITAKKVFLAHAASSPLPQRVAAAMAEYAGRASTEGQWEYIYAEYERRAREYGARLLGAEVDEIAFISSTSMGLSLVASGYPWREGDNLVLADGDFPSNIYPWLNLAARGAQAKLIPRRSDGAVTPEDVLRTIDSHTRLVSLSSANFVSGYRLDAAAVGRLLAERGILFCVDGVQTLGAYPLDTSEIDFVSTSAHKWLLGPFGIGILYVKKRNLGRIAPVLAGWKSVQECKSYLKYDLCFTDSARRFEPGGLNVIGMVGLQAALGLLLEVGIENIAERLGKLRRIIIEGLNEKGFDVLSPPDPAKGSGIVSFRAGRLDIARLRDELDRAGFVVSLRETLDDGKCIRVAPHFYNTEEEIRLFLGCLPGLA